MSPPTAAEHGLYRGAVVALLTQHGKQAWVAGPLAQALGCRIVHTDAYDTDLLGTFTREVPRPGSQREAARRKARIGMELVGASVGLASEGAFGPDPMAGVVPWDTEILLWLDSARSLEVVGVAQGPACHLQGTVRTLEELEAFALRAGFPSHHLVLRPSHPDHPGVRKGLADTQALHHAFANCRRESADGTVHVENDLRAFCNPTRQQLIHAAAQDLARKLASACPRCRAPGFAVSRHHPGLPCLSCGQPTRLPRALVWSCTACGHAQEQAVASDGADPTRCDHCNP